jgi:hypothetical protein
MHEFEFNTISLIDILLNAQQHEHKNVQEVRSVANNLPSM